MKLRNTLVPVVVIAVMAIALMAPTALASAPVCTGITLSTQLPHTQMPYTNGAFGIRFDGVSADTQTILIQWEKTTAPGVWVDTMTMRIEDYGPPHSPAWYYGYLSLPDVPGWGDGVYNIRGRLTNDTLPVHETSYSPTTQVIWDKTAPSLSIVKNKAPVYGYWYGQNVQVSLPSSDGLSGLAGPVIYHNPVDPTLPAWKTYTGPFTLSDGNNEVYAQVYDRAGNVNNLTPVPIYISNLHPTVEITQPSGNEMNAGTISASYRIWYYGDEGGPNSNGITNTKLYIDGQLVKTSANSNENYDWDVTNVADGSWHELTVKATDSLRHTSTLTKSAMLRKSGSSPRPVVSTWYFAEGNTLAEFDTYFCVENMSGETANLTFNFMLETGETVQGTGTVAPNARGTFNMKAYVSGLHNVSTRIDSDQQVVCERPMYFNYKNKWNGGTDVMGLKTLQKEFYFAEGTTRKNAQDGEFEEWLTLMNPSSSPVTATVTYMTAEDAAVKTYTVGATSRLTLDVANEAGLNKDVSVKVVSSDPIAAERPMYFNYRNAWDDGTTIVGAAAPQKTFCFAEGTTRADYDEWLTIQNPNSAATDVDVTFYDANGGKTVKTYSVEGNRRRTVNVREAAGANKDLSMKVEANLPIVAERPMYFNYNGTGWTGGSDAMGISALGTEYTLAEGTTQNGFQTWLTVFNPGNEPCNVTATYLEPSGQSTAGPSHQIAAHSRLTISVNSEAGAGKDVSTRIKSDKPIVVERPMYFNYSNRNGGSIASGFLLK